jgi:hypothetical protein
VLDLALGKSDAIEAMRRLEVLKFVGSIQLVHEPQGRGAGGRDFAAAHGRLRARAS